MCVHLYSATFAYFKPAWFFLPAQIFSSSLGSCVALRHAISDCVKFPITLPILRPWEQLDRVWPKAHLATFQQWPACLEYNQLSSTNTASGSLSTPPGSYVSPGTVWAGGRDVWILLGLLDLSSLPLPSQFWNLHGLSAATQPTWQGTFKFD